MDRLWKMSGWLAREARFLDTNLELFKQFCMKLLELGVLLNRSWLHIRALHPQYAGMARLWTRETGIEERYLHHGLEETSTYLTSPVRFAVEGREPGRWRLDAGAALPFPLLDELRAAGYVDYAIEPLLYSDGTAAALPGTKSVCLGRNQAAQSRPARVWGYLPWMGRSTSRSLGVPMRCGRLSGQLDGRHEEHWYCAAREIAAADSTSSAVKLPTRRKKRKT